jgi:type IV secretory pathway VirB10-like protein
LKFAGRSCAIATTAALIIQSPKREDPVEYNSINKNCKQNTYPEHNNINRIKSDSKKIDTKSLQNLGDGTGDKDNTRLHPPIPEEWHRPVIQTEQKIETERNDDIREIAVVQGVKFATEIAPQSERMDESNDEHNTDYHNCTTDNAATGRFRGFHSGSRI